MELEDIPNFRDGVMLINRTADEARHRERARRSTKTVNYGGGAPPVPAPSAPVGRAQSAATAMNDEIARLASFHQQGILSDEEFTAGKRKLLGL